MRTTTMTTIQTQVQDNVKGTPTRSGFQPIPTRIRDTRDANPLPSLLVEPAAKAQRAAVCESLGELSTKLADVHRTAAEAYLSQGLYEQSLPHLAAATTFAPSELEYHNQLGFVRYVTGDDIGAIASFQQVLASDGTNGEAWFNLGMVMFGQNQFGDAETCFQRATENGAEDAQTWNNRGVCLWQLQRKTDAKVCFQRALKLDPTDLDAQHNLASAS
ncbi:MAG: tetratricopeptide repeat protein [Planctomycetes bacterium]|nr:tetratricopeptide repeat protein [Planctomycetota bacterium]